MPTAKLHKRLGRLIIPVLLFTALVSGGIFFLIYRYLSTPWLAFIMTQFSLLTLLGIIGVVYLLYRRNPAPLGRNTGTAQIEAAPEADHSPVINFNFEQYDWPLDLSGPQMNGVIRSIMRNSNRLFAVEEQLSSRFRPRDAGDSHTRRLVCQLKICTSRMKNDLAGILANSQGNSVTDDQVN